MEELSLQDLLRDSGTRNATDHYKLGIISNNEKEIFYREGFVVLSNGGVKINFVTLMIYSKISNILPVKIFQFLCLVFFFFFE